MRSIRLNFSATVLTLGMHESENFRKFKTLLKGHCHGGKTFQVRILSSGWYHIDRTLFQLHYTGMVIFTKTRPVFVGFRYCKMCFCILEFCACQPVTVPL